MHDIDRTHFRGVEHVSGADRGGGPGPAGMVLDSEVELVEETEGPPGDESAWSIGSLWSSGRQLVREGADWVTLRLALARGERDENRLTDLVFNARHPERGGRPLQAGEQQLVREWLDLRDRVVRPALRAGAGSPTPGPGAGGPAPTQPVSAGSPAALDALRPLVGRATQPTMAGAVAILRALAAFWNIPWQLPFTIFEHEGGFKGFGHPDGVMQTIARSRQGIIPRLPRPLKLVLLGLPPTDTTADAALVQRLHREFQGSLAVQLAAGTQELVSNLQQFNGYVALAFVGYNAGPGNAYRMATGRSPSAGPRPTGPDWEEACRAGATLLHRPPSAVDAPVGVWQCDANLAVRGRSGWWRYFPVRDKRTQRLLIAYQYLRSVRSCIREQEPGVPCGRSNHKQRLPGSGRLRCLPTRNGALEKVHDPARFSSPYRAVAQAEFRPIPDDGAPLKAVGGQLTKVAPASP